MAAATPVRIRVTAVCFESKERIERFHHTSSAEEEDDEKCDTLVKQLDNQVLQQYSFIRRSKQLLLSEHKKTSSEVKTKQEGGTENVKNTKSQYD